MMKQENKRWNTDKELCLFGKSILITLLAVVEFSQGGSENWRG